MKQIIKKEFKKHETCPIFIWRGLNNNNNNPVWLHYQNFCTYLQTNHSEIGKILLLTSLIFYKISR